MGLFAPAWQSNNEKKAMKAVNEITNQSELMDVALSAYKASIRNAAVKKITDNCLLLRLVRKSDKFEVADTAVNQITDQNILVDVIHQFSDAMRKQILSRINDSSALIKLINNSGYSYSVTDVHEVINKTTDSIIYTIETPK